MRKKERLQARRPHLAHEVGRVAVAQMPAPARDALLERHGAIGRLEEHGVVVRLEDGARGAREGVPHAEGGRTHVRAHEQRTLPVVEQVAHGIGGVVRNRERRHGQIAHGERLRRLEHAPAVVHAREDRDGDSVLCVPRIGF